MYKKYTKKQQRELEEKIFRIVKNVLSVIGLIIAFLLIYYGYFHVYKPKERKFVNGSNYAYALMQKELRQMYKKTGYIYNSEDEKFDKFCDLMQKKYSPNGGNCVDSNFAGYKQNFVFKKTKIAVYGLEKSPRNLSGILVKDFFVDVDGDDGENTMGVDRVPLRVYSSGRLGGMITPVNCNSKHIFEFDIPYSPICGPGIDTNFLDTNIPFGFDVLQIGGESGKTSYLNRNVSFGRADCMAFGGEMIDADNYCETRSYPWLSACYDEFPCAVELARTKL